MYVNGELPGTVVVGDRGRFLTQYVVREAPASPRGGEVSPSLNNLKICAGGDVDIIATGSISVSDLELEDGAQLTFHRNASTNGMLIVTNSVVVPANGRVKIRLPENLPVVTGPAPVYPILKFEGEGEFDLTRFEVDAVKSLGDLPHVSMEMRDGVLCLVCKEIVKLDLSTSEGSVISPFNAATDAGGNFLWSDHLAPQPGKDYLVNIGNKFPTPGSTTVPVKFAGDSLTAVGA